MPRFKRVLAVETSCDDTSVAIVHEGGSVEFLSSANQDQFHRPFGGIVPEIAGRNHTLKLLPLISQALEQTQMKWQDIDALAVTNRPGLVGSLLVGVVTVKALGLALSKPFIGINHLEGHILAPFLSDKDYQPTHNLSFPYLALAVSGGHTALYKVNALGDYEVLGRTVDDAAGEAFDKFAKMVGLGWPGGSHVDKMAQGGDSSEFSFPTPMLYSDNFSFSGLKASAQRLLSGMSPQQITNHLSGLCASFQESIVQSLAGKLESAIIKTNIKDFVVTGGVSANSRLRIVASEIAARHSARLDIAPLRYCTDNAAMIGLAGLLRLNRGEQSDDDLGVSPEVTL